MEKSFLQTQSFLALVLCGSLIVGCSGGSGSSGQKQTPTSSDQITSVPVTYWKIDSGSSCANGVVAELAFDKQSRAGVVTELPCAGGAGSEHTDSQFLTYERQFSDYVVYKGDVFIQKEHFLDNGDRAPILYCQIAETENQVEFFQLVFETDPVMDDCRTQRAYRDPFDFYYYGGGHGSPCSSFGLVTDGSRVSFSDESFDVSIDLTAGDRENGYDGTALLRASQGDVSLRMKCFVP